jgi:hypothetical protein
MRKYTFIVELENGKTYRVYAFNQREAEILVQAYLILQGLDYRIEVTTGEKEGLATRWTVNFDKELASAVPISLSVNSF